MGRYLRSFLILGILSLFASPVPAGQNSGGPHNPAPSPTAEETLKWIDGFFKERGGLDSVVEKYANGAVFKIDNPWIVFDDDGLIYNDKTVSYSAISWDEVRSFAFVQGGGIDIYCLMHHWMVRDPYNLERQGTRAVDDGGSPMHLQFHLAKATTDDYSRISKALTHLVELNGGFAKSPKDVF